MAKKDFKEAVENDPRFVNAEVGKVEADVADGKMVVEDLGEGLVGVKGPFGDTSVTTLDGAYASTDPELHQRAVDQAIDYSRVNAEDDPRHSSHPDHTNPDGSPANGEDNVVNSDLEVDKQDRNEQ